MGSGRPWVVVCIAVLLLGLVASAAGRNETPTGRASSVQGSAGESARFQPAATSFISKNRGWVLGRYRCGDCAAVRLTVDGGRHWRSLPYLHEPLSYYVPAAGTLPTEKGVSDLVFADPRNGFLFGPRLLATHDGGRSWIRQPLLQVQALDVGGGYAYALTQQRTNPAHLWREPIGSDRWERLAAPRTSDDVVAVEAETLVLLQTGFHGPGPSAGQLGRIWVSSDRGVHWRRRPLPCTTRDGGAAVVAIVPGRRSSWLLDCYANEQSSQAQDTQHHLYRTTDAGRSWMRMPDPTHHNAPDLLAANGAGHAFLATAGGAGDVLYGTLDGGRDWQPLLHSGGSFYGWADLRFLTAMTGFVVGPTHYAPEHLYRTDDGGRTWHILSIG